MIAIARACRREIEELPQLIREDLADAIARLEQGLSLAMPLSRPMPSVGRGVHELRLRDPSGSYRIFYAMGGQNRIVVLHAFKKKSEQTPFRVIELVRRRIKEALI